jgi:hypothetical protein
MYFFVQVSPGPKDAGREPSSLYRSSWSVSVSEVVFVLGVESDATGVGIDAVGKEWRGLNVADPRNSPTISFGFSLLSVRRRVQRVGVELGPEVREREEKRFGRRVRWSGGIVG